MSYHKYYHRQTITTENCAIWSSNKIGLVMQISLFSYYPPGQPWWCSLAAWSSWTCRQNYQLHRPTSVWGCASGKHFAHLQREHLSMSIKISGTNTWFQVFPEKQTYILNQECPLPSDAWVQHRTQRCSCSARIFHMGSYVWVCGWWPGSHWRDTDHRFPRVGTS